MELPRVQHLAAPEGHLGWQDLGGDGPALLEMGCGFMASVEDAADQPRYLRWVQGLAEIGRLLRYDPPGVGTSDAGEDPPTLADWADAATLVLDAAGVQRAHVVAASASVMIALHFAARHPTRLASLVLVNGSARVGWAEDYPHGLDPAVGEAITRAATDPMGEAGVDPALLLSAPSAADDPEFRSWWGRVARRNARPRVAGPINAEIFSSDLRPFLKHIAVPTLVIVRRDNALGTGTMKALADGIPGARYVELPGADLLPFLGDAAGLLEEIRGHVTGNRHSTTQRVFAAVLFTDLVGSTQELERRGDDSWRNVLADHGHMVRTELSRHGGRLVQDLGDGTLCTFESPGESIRCALALVGRAQAHLGIAMRAGIHAGEVEMRGDDLAGITVHVAARVSAVASGGEVLVSSTVTDLVAGAGFVFDDRGSHEFKGVSGLRQVWAARTA